MNIQSRLRKHILFLAATATLLSFSTVTPSSAQTTTTAKGRRVAQEGTGNRTANRAFCRQITDSQAAIAAAKGDAAAKLTLTAAEWVKIEGLAPAEVKPKVTLVRKAFQDASAAKTNSAVKAPAVVEAGKAITNFVAANCVNRGPGGGFDSAALADYRACLEKNGVKLPAAGPAQSPNRSSVDPADPKLAAAIKACQGKLPAGGRGFGGGGFAAIRDCLAKKGVTLPSGRGSAGRNGAGSQGTGAGAEQGGPPLDAKTQKAIADCRAEAAKTTTTTKKQ